MTGRTGDTPGNPMVPTDPAKAAEPARAAASIHYPESDGRPLGETEAHIMAILRLIERLRHFTRDRSDTYVIGDMLLYYEAGNPSAVVVPDVMVVRGVDRHMRRTFKLWEERVAPSLIVEVTSRASRLEDLGPKRALYATLGVRELVVFDPLGDYLRPRLRAFALQAGELLPVAVTEDMGFESREVCCILRASATDLLVVDPDSGEAVPDLAQALARADAAMARAAALEAELAALRRLQAID